MGDQLFVAGMTANSPTGIEGGVSMYEQTRAVFTKINRAARRVLRARRDYFTAEPPASTLVEVSALAAPGLLIEVEVLAIIGSSRGSERPRG